MKTLSMTDLFAVVLAFAVGSALYTTPCGFVFYSCLEPASGRSLPGAVLSNAPGVALLMLPMLMGLTLTAAAFDAAGRWRSGPSGGRAGVGSFLRVRALLILIFMVSLFWQVVVPLHFKLDTRAAAMRSTLGCVGIFFSACIVVGSIRWLCRRIDLIEPFARPNGLRGGALKALAATWVTLDASFLLFVAVAIFSND